jgi:uncharacterized membrane protein YphA (DoxX/SURF4 family)
LSKLSTFVRRSLFSLYHLNFVSVLFMRFFVGSSLLVSGLFKLQDTVASSKIFNETFPHYAFYNGAMLGEIILGALLVLGLFTRLSAFLVLVAGLVLMGLVGLKGMWLLFFTVEPTHVSGLLSSVMPIVFWMKTLFLPVFSFGATVFFIFLLNLVFVGAGKFLSLDYWWRTLAQFAFNTQADRIYVGNLTSNIRAQELQEIFGEFGPILDVKVLRDSKSRHKAFGFITFKNAADAKRAISQMDGFKYQGRELKVKRAIKK